MDKVHVRFINDQETVVTEMCIRDRDFTLGIGYLGGSYKEYIPLDGHYVWQTKGMYSCLLYTSASVLLLTVMFAFFTTVNACGNAKSDELQLPVPSAAGSYSPDGKRAHTRSSRTGRARRDSAGR